MGGEYSFISGGEAMLKILVLIVGILLLAKQGGAAGVEDVYAGDMVRFPGPWAFQLGRQSIILVTDKDLEDLSDPDKVLNLSLTYDKYEDSLRGVCESAKAQGIRTIILSFDHFFAQYRPGQSEPRKLTPDMDEYVERIAAISNFAAQYGIGLELSLLSPLEIGNAYIAKTGESGKWMQHRKGLRDPVSGTYSVEYWQQKMWANNKGPLAIKDAGVRVFAFSETPIGNGTYRVVAPNSIVEITETAQVEYLQSDDDPIRRRVRVHGSGRTDIGELNRVFVVQQYISPEMDYFSPKATEFLHTLIDKYADAGVKLNALYSDEMHIQQDWDYFAHHDNGEFTLRYVSDGFRERFAQLYGSEYLDFAKYLIYFVYGQEEFSHTVDAKESVMHVLGDSPEDVRRTALLRSRYYQLLQDGVVDLFANAKKYAEQRFGRSLLSRAHATWAESPTIDHWRTEPGEMWSSKYEYTSNFVWSCTVHQAAAACHDYFKWGDFLTGNGNDHAECGWLDRNYFGLALGCSTGIINDIPYSYAAHWGSPHVIARLRGALIDAYGTAGSELHTLVQDMQHRDVEVLMLYPLDLVSVEERFGSWMTQYGYANYITQAKLLEKGKVLNGAIELGGRRFSTLVALFEPFPSQQLLDTMERMLSQGGRVIWSGPPPVLTKDGKDALGQWCRIFGVNYNPGIAEGKMAPGAVVSFEGALAKLTPQTILTDMLVDRIYPVTPSDGTQTLAKAKGFIVGTGLTTKEGGHAIFLGYRPRDDQSASLGYETRNWFEILDAVGAYPPTGKIKRGNDNTEYVSRTTDYLACRFPNGTVSIAPHLRTVVEGWSGGFGRDEKEDAEYLKNNPPPSDKIELKSFVANGHRVTYSGVLAVSFRVGTGGELVGFSGSNCKEITVDGRKWVFADKALSRIAWAPVSESRKVKGGAVMQIFVEGNAEVKIPLTKSTGNVALFAQGNAPGMKGAQIPCKIERGYLRFTADKTSSGRWLYLVPGE